MNPKIRQYCNSPPNGFLFVVYALFTIFSLSRQPMFTNLSSTPPFASLLRHENDKPIDLPSDDNRLNPPSTLNRRVRHWFACSVFENVCVLVFEYLHGAYLDCWIPSHLKPKQTSSTFAPTVVRFCYTIIKKPLVTSSAVVKQHKLSFDVRLKFLFIANGEWSWSRLPSSFVIVKFERNRFWTVFLSLIYILLNNKVIYCILTQSSKNVAQR